ncbi:MAG: FAD-dependent oxidoreductase, partial [Acidimicrobiia bacterium]|nr:FAD-dependent oxidoreductase [Acidimicrobiia bacterium]
SVPDVVVVGGGLAGLAAAATVAAAGRTVVVHERRGVLGGRGRSVNQDGFTFNQGPHALYRGGPAERLLSALGVSLRGGRPPLQGRLVFDGRSEIAPAGPATLLRTRALGPRGKLEIGRLLSRLPKLSAARLADVSAEDWIAGSVSGERPAEMMRALVRLATYANQPAELSADVAITQMQAALGPGVLYLDGGWQTIVDQLRETPGVQIVTSDGLAELPDRRAVIVAVGGSQATGALLEKTFDVGPAASASCLDLGLSRRPDAAFVLGGDVPFYFSNHSAVADLAPEGQHHAAAVQYLGPHDEPDPARIEAFTRHAGVRDDDIVVTRRLHRMTTVTAIPTAARGGLAGRPRVTDTGHDSVFIAGDWVGPDGHLLDAVMASADAAAKAALRVVDRARVG